MTTTPFNKYQKNTHSQNGEDGVIQEILDRLKINDTDKWCVEFGAADGIQSSNTFALVEKGWKAVYIEGEKNSFNKLLNTVNNFPQIIPINVFVNSNRAQKDSLDKLLQKTSVPKIFELLSIDIDSFDLDVWESLTNYIPKIVIIEINSSVPPGILWRHSPKTQGNTFSATLNVAIQKKYTLVCHTGNLIFVKNDLVSKLNIDDRFIRYPELLFLFDSPWFPNNLFTIIPKELVDYIPNFLRPLAGKIKRRLVD